MVATHKKKLIERDRKSNINKNLDFNIIVLTLHMDMAMEYGCYTVSKSLDSLASKCVIYQSKVFMETWRLYGEILGFQS